MLRTLQGISKGVLMLLIIGSCGPRGSRFTDADNEVKLITLDPGHFHAALVQKIMYSQVDPAVHVYARKGRTRKITCSRLRDIIRGPTTPPTGKNGSILALIISRKWWMISWAM